MDAAAKSGPTADHTELVKLWEKADGINLDHGRMR
jgi:hypothetical protein